MMVKMDSLPIDYCGYDNLICMFVKGEDSSQSKVKPTLLLSENRTVDDNGFLSWKKERDIMDINWELVDNIRLDHSPGVDDCIFLLSEALRRKYAER